MCAGQILHFASLRSEPALSAAEGMTDEVRESNHIGEGVAPWMLKFARVAGF